MVELADGRFFSHDGNYTDYLLAKAERQAADAVVEHKRQMFLRRELEWVRRGPARPAHASPKCVSNSYYEVAGQAAPAVEEEVELCIPPPPQLGNRVVECSNLGVAVGGQNACSAVSISRSRTASASAWRVAMAWAKPRCSGRSSARLAPTEGTVKVGQLTKFNYVDQGRLQLREERTALEEVSDGAEFVMWGEARLSVRAYLKRFLFADDRISRLGEAPLRRRTQPAAARAHFETGRQLPHPRRTDQRSRSAYAARAGGSVDRFSRASSSSSATTAIS